MRGAGWAVATMALLAATACAGDGRGGATPPLHPVVLAGSGATHPTVAILPGDGTVLVTWVHLTGSGDDQDVHLVRIPRGGDPEPPVRVNHQVGDATPHEQAPAQVAVGPGGEVYVMWQKRRPFEGRRFGTTALRMARSLDGGRTFEPAIDVADWHGEVPASHTFHTLLVTPGGEIVASWLDGRASLVQEAQGGGGEDPGTEVRVAVSTDGGASFGASTLVASNVCPCCRTALARGPDGALYVAWRHIWKGPSGEDVRDLTLARSEDGGITFGPPIRIHQDGWVHDGCPHAGPALAFDGDGGLHALWYTGNPEGPGIFHARSTDRGATFGHATPLVSGSWVPPSRVALVTLPGGALQAAWEERREDPPSFGRALIPAGGSPGRGAMVAGTFPALAAAPGQRAVAWLDGESVLLAVEEVP